ncbi:helix-turn-helix domain-containing protein [Ochrobactrum sp. C6C9]|uniref:helix-turn-helix domain-containing protein n=1 Tax=Ochrobactrum sp. C6C9 TaxID=2736662 RepID=UPI0035303036|nr:helix-turn-helix domain-containing protein [Ochrobactrum sp. C6C9]
MSAAYSFREVKLQWLQQLSCDRDLSDNAKCVALYIVTTHLNGHTEKAWPSYKTIADATGKSVKTVQRAIKDLELSGWFEVVRGNGVGHNTEYRPSAETILRASQAREKTDKIVTLYPAKGGQNRPAMRSDSSVEGGQICPPNPEKEKINKPNAREREASQACGYPPIALVFVSDHQAVQLGHWRDWLQQHGFATLEELGTRSVKSGRSGYALPGYWPPASGGEHEAGSLDFFRRRSAHLAQGNPVADHGRRVS